MDPLVASSLTGLLVMQGVKMFSDSAPKIDAVRKAAPHSGTAADLRVAELEAVAVMVLAGTAISAMSKTPVPLWLALATSATMVGIYEWVLHQAPEVPALDGVAGLDGPTLVAVN